MTICDAELEALVHPNDVHEALVGSIARSYNISPVSTLTQHAFVVPLWFSPASTIVRLPRSGAQNITDLRTVLNPDVESTMFNSRRIALERKSCTNISSPISRIPFELLGIPASILCCRG